MAYIPGEEPRGLRIAARQFWIDMTQEYEFAPHELLTLGEACRMKDMIDRMETRQKGEDLLSVGAQGQEIIAPLIPELRQYRSALARLIAALKIPEADSEGSSDAADRSAAGRALVAHRWARGA